MADQTLDIPNGTTFEFKDNKLVFGHDSDIVIRTNMGGYKFQKIFSKSGSVTVVPPEGVEFEVEEIEAKQGDIYLNGRVKADRAHARTIHFQEGTLRANRLEGANEVILDTGELDVLHVSAPKVTIDPNITGTCLVIECRNELGNFKAKGGFRSADEVRAAMSRFTELADGGSPSLPTTEEPLDADSTQKMMMMDTVESISADKTVPPSAATEEAAPARQAATQEFRAAPPVEKKKEEKEEAKAPAPSLPRSSVFRKRK